jgi:hypothetical protein
MIMTYMQSNLAFAGGIQELTPEETVCVSGGLAPAAAYVVGKAIGYTAAAAAGTAAGVAFAKGVKEAAKALDKLF